MDFVNEKDLLLAQICQDRGQIALDLQRRAGGLLKGNAHFIRDNGGEGRLAQPGRAIEQDMVEGLAAGPRRLNRNRQIFFDFGLSNELPKPLRTQL